MRYKIKEGIIKAIKDISWSFLRKVSLFLFAGTIIMCVGAEIINPMNAEIKLAKDLAQLPIPIFCVVIVDILVCIFWGIKLYFTYIYIDKTKPVLIAHSTFKEANLALLTDEGQMITVESKNHLNIIEDMKHVAIGSEEFRYLIKRQDEFVQKFKVEREDNVNYSYLGISHTPLIVRMGTQIGDGIRFRPVHIAREEISYKYLNNSTKYPKLQVKKSAYTPVMKELIVSIATSYKIEEDQLTVFQLNKRARLKFELDKDELDVDSIKSEIQLNDYVKTILVETRNYVMIHKIQKVHFVISSSVALTFLLGQRLTNSYDVDTIVYSFVKDDPKFYPWGIAIFKDVANCVICN